MAHLETLEEPRIEGLVTYPLPPGTANQPSERNVGGDDEVAEGFGAAMRQVLAGKFLAV